MTLVSSIILDALRETNIIPIGQDPTDEQNTEGLRRLQNIVSSVLGNEAGENLSPLPLGQNEIVSPGGYPWYSNSLPGNVYVPTNMRVMCNLTADGYLNFAPNPDDGARMGVVDVSQNFGTFNLTLIGNGRSIEGDDAITLDTSAVSQEWFYRADTGNWARVTNLTLTSEMPFPPEFDDFFIIMLAARINPRYGQNLDPASMEMLGRAKKQFSARYKQIKPMPSEDALLFLTNCYRYYGRYANRGAGETAQYFNVGFPY